MNKADRIRSLECDCIIGMLVRESLLGEYEARKKEVRIMMDYDVFKEVICKRIKGKLPPLFADAEVKVGKVWKGNRELDMMTVALPEGKDVQMNPVIYLNEEYEELKKGCSIEEILNRTAEIVVNFTGRFPEEKVDMDFKGKESQIIMGLVNAEKNRGMLASVPHRIVHEFAVVYRLMLGGDDKGYHTVRINHDIMGRMGLTEAELYELAVQNTQRIFPAEIRNPSDLMKMTGISVPAEMDPDPVLFITCRGKTNGAVNMLFNDLLDRVAERIGSPFYIMPSSVHEIDALPFDSGTAEELQGLLEKINEDQELEDYLGSSVYCYDVKKGALERAVN